MRRPKDKNRDINSGDGSSRYSSRRGARPRGKQCPWARANCTWPLRCAHYVSFTNNNGRVFLSERDALEELGATNRESHQRAGFASWSISASS